MIVSKFNRQGLILPNKEIRMRQLISFISLIMFVCPLLAQETKIQELTKQYGIPGIQLVCIKGNKEESFNLGVIARDSARTVTSKTIFEAASLSKCVFAYAVLRLYDRGIISLDEPLSKYLPHYERFDSGDSRYERITARMV